MSEFDTERLAQFHTAQLEENHRGFFSPSSSALFVSISGGVASTPPPAGHSVELHRGATSASGRG